jgi:lysophospholipase L1-like esterase
MRMLLPTLLVLSLCVGPRTTQAADFELKDGDRVVLLGSTLIEREQRYGYWETALTARYPDRNITFRNLAWSGDTVWGDSRVAFDLDKPGIGLKRMVELTLAEKPTVIFICYGTNESFEGEKGLEKFTKGLDALLDALAPAQARIVLLSPVPFDNKGQPSASAQSANRRLALYRNSIRRVAEIRQLLFGDLFGSLYDEKRARVNTAQLTWNGMHLHEYGYSRTAETLLTCLGLRRSGQSFEIKVAADRTPAAEGADVSIVNGPHLTLDVTRKQLPLPLDPNIFNEPVWIQGSGVVRVQGLDADQVTLRVDGRPVQTLPGKIWSKPLPLPPGPDNEQVEKLRHAIIEKNELYFHRWRPQNETYLFGFRKHEQGKNAKEVAAFDPLVAEKEKEIAKLRVPKTRRFEWVPAKD